MRGRHYRPDVTVRSVFRKGDRLYTVVGIADEPTVEIRDVISGAIENHVISSPNFAEYEHLRSDADSRPSRGEDAQPPEGTAT